MNVYEFITADKQWLWFISQNRRRAYADVLKGKIDAKVFGDVESDMACEDAIKRLLPDRLEKQFCFINEKAIARLEMIEVKRYEL